MDQGSIIAGEKTATVLYRLTETGGYLAGDYVDLFTAALEKRATLVNANGERRIITVRRPLQHPSAGQPALSEFLWLRH